MNYRFSLFALSIALILPALPAAADETRDAAQAQMKAALGTVPEFIALLPEDAQPGAWALMQGLSGNPNGSIPPKFRELIALAVAAQIPCSYCTYAHTAFAKAHGATDTEVREAIGYAGEVRLWSTILNGSGADLSKFETQIDGILTHAAEMANKAN